MTAAFAIVAIAVAIGLGLTIRQRRRHEPRGLHAWLLAGIYLHRGFDAFWDALLEERKRAEAAADISAKTSKLLAGQITACLAAASVPAMRDTLADSLLTAMLSLVEAHTRLPLAELQINFMLARPFAEQHRENPRIIQFAWEAEEKYREALVLQRYLDRGTAVDFALPVHADHKRCLPGAPTAFAQGIPVYFDVSTVGKIEGLSAKHRKDAKEHFAPPSGSSASSAFRSWIGVTVSASSTSTARNRHSVARRRTRWRLRHCQCLLPSYLVVSCRVTAPSPRLERSRMTVEVRELVHDLEKIAAGDLTVLRRMTQDYAAWASALAAGDAPAAPADQVPVGTTPAKAA